MAILDFDSYGITDQETLVLTSRLRTTLVQSDVFRTIERGQMLSILEEQDFQLTGCTSDECAVEVGQLLGAQLMLAGSIGKIGVTYTIDIRIIDVETGSISKSSSYDIQGEIDLVLTKGIAEVVRRITGRTTTDIDEGPPVPTPALATETSAQYQVLEARNAPWSAGTAYTLPEGRWEKGLFQPLRYGQTERLEWATHPVLNLVVPNLRVKVAHREFRGWALATRHGFHYPTPLLRLVKRPGIGGLISPESDIPDIPHILAARSELLATRVISPSLWLTGKGGVSIALKTGEMDERTTIDLPVVFPRMALFLHGYQLNLGMDLLGKLRGRWAIWADVDLLMIPGAEESFSLEHKGMAIWSRSERFQVLIGYKLVYGAYPHYPRARTQWHLLPLLDLQWARQRKAKR